MKIDKLFYFRILLLIWILGINLLLQITQIEFGWVIFISNIMLFVMSGDINKNFVSVEVGGLVGLLFAGAMVFIIGILQPIVGQVASVMIPLTVVLFVIILLNPVMPMLFNNVGFAYFTCALISAENFIMNFGEVIMIYLIGSVFVNGVCIALLKQFIEV